VSQCSTGVQDFRTPVRTAATNPVAAPRVLVVENSGAELDKLARALQRHGFDVESAMTGSEALQSYEDVDFILLDLELPDLDGLEVCRAIRLTHNTPMVAVTARGSELDRVLGLRAGLDDYVVKPYGFLELMARMEAIMRGRNPRPPIEQVVAHGPLVIDARAREVVLHGRPIEVTRKEFDLLLLLASQPDTVVPRKRIMQQIWSDSWSRRTVDTHVSSLRRKLGDSEWIITVRGVGFRFGRWYGSAVR
jgi:DNA-binding response OmpR family regulator